MHYIKKEDVYLPVDLSEKDQAEAVHTFYNDDWYGYAEDYFSLVGQVAEKTCANIVGHFDLIAKFNEGDFNLHRIKRCKDKKGRNHDGRQESFER